MDKMLKQALALVEQAGPIKRGKKKRGYIRKDIIRVKDNSGSYIVIGDKVSGKSLTKFFENEKRNRN